MSGPLAKLEARIEALESASDEIREATREAHAALKDLRTVEKSIRDLLSGDAREMVRGAIEKQVAAGLADYAETIRVAQDGAFDLVMNAFETLGALYLGASDDGPSLHETADRHLSALREMRRDGVPRPG